MGEGFLFLNSPRNKAGGIPYIQFSPFGPGQSLAVSTCRPPLLWISPIRWWGSIHLHAPFGVLSGFAFFFETKNGAEKTRLSFRAPPNYNLMNRYFALKCRPLRVPPGATYPKNQMNLFMQPQKLLILPKGVVLPRVLPPIILMCIRSE